MSTLEKSDIAEDIESKIFFLDENGNLGISGKRKEVLYLNLLRDLICKNQINLLQYIFLANEKHKELKQSLKATSLVSSALDEIQGYSDEEIDLVRQHYIKLEEHFYQGLRQSANDIFECLYKYFRGRSRAVPRLCIKVFESGKIKTLFRNTTVNYQDDDEDFLLESLDTGILEIIEENKKHYLCNDIPTAVIDKKYKNPRIREDIAKDYKRPNFLEKFFGRTKDKSDKKWVECWLDSDTDENLENYYKSTLIIPMSFARKQLSQEFLKHLQKTEESEIEQSIICGFFCLDHVETFFFDEQPDVAIAYICADILSIYLMYQLVCTQYSRFTDIAIRIMGETLI
jgi:hypothetical protein